MWKHRTAGSGWIRALHLVQMFSKAGVEVVVIDIANVVLQAVLEFAPAGFCEVANVGGAGNPFPHFGAEIL